LAYEDSGKLQANSIILSGGAIYTSVWGGQVKELEEYAMHALECRAAAAKSSKVAEQEYLYQMADHWEQLARRRAAYMHLESILAELLEDKNGNHKNGGAAAA
jgi:hypothetical protein